MESPFAIGDWVEISGQSGQVSHISWRSIRLVTLFKDEIIVTNNTVSDSEIINYSRPVTDVWKSVAVWVSYQFPVAKVERALIEAATGVPHVVSDPSPVVWIKNYDKYLIEYELWYVISNYAHGFGTATAVRARIWYALQRAGIAFPDQTHAIRLYPDQLNVQLAQQKENYLARVRQGIEAFPLFKALSNAQIEQLAQATQLAQYYPGEALVRQGDEGDSLFIIQTGITGIYIVGQDGGDLRVDQRIAGEFFGEMSLLTGQPRTASVLAETETDVLIINKLAFTQILSKDPSILDILLDALDERKRNLEAKTEADMELARQKAAADRSALLGKIINFLGISLGNK